MEFEPEQSADGQRLYRYIARLLGHAPRQEDIDGFTDWVEGDSNRLEASLMGNHQARCVLASRYFGGSVETERRVA